MKKTLILLFVVILFAACKNEKEQRSEMNETAPKIDHEQAVHPENVGELDDIQLNQGEPWEVKPEISERIDRISQTISDYSLEATKDYRELGAKLQEEKKELETLIESNAEYRSNLEAYLNSLEEKIERLRQVSAVQEGKRLVDEVEEQLQRFSSYFN